MSLSLSLYIYIHIYIYRSSDGRPNSDAACRSGAVPWVGEALPAGRKHRRHGTPTTTRGCKVETRGLHNLRSGSAVFFRRLGGRVPQNAGPSALGLRILDRVSLGRPDCVPCGAPILRGRIVKAQQIWNPGRPGCVRHAGPLPADRKNTADLEPGSPGFRVARRFVVAEP